MWLFRDVLSVVVLAALAPFVLARRILGGKKRSDWAGRFGWARPLPAARGPRVLVHAVSVGEVNAIRLLVRRLTEHPAAPEVVIATTTDTGMSRAQSMLGDRHQVVRYPLDASFGVRRFLSAIQPDLVALVELEVWPGFTGECKRRGIPVAVINGRLSERSAKRYRMVRPLVAPMFRRLSAVAAQDQTYATRFHQLGVPRNRLSVTGTMKWDAVSLQADPPAAEALAESMGIDRSRPLVVGGSTAPGEHELLHRSVPDGVQLLCAPRRPEWFDQASEAMPGCVRRSSGERGNGADRFCLDSIGELRNAYWLANVAVVGRSFGTLHGSDMMEPIGLGKPTIVGPATTDFADTVAILRDADALIQTTADQLSEVLHDLLSDSARREQLVSNGHRVIEQHRGATDRHVELLMGLLPTER